MTREFFKIREALPNLGVGLGLRREMLEETLESTAEIDWVEITPEAFLGCHGKSMLRLDRAASVYKIISHGVNLSLGSADELNPTYLRQLKQLLDTYDVAWWSDHVSFASADNVYVNNLLPLPRTPATVRHFAERIKRAQDFIGRPALIENISFYMPNPPGTVMPEAQFISEILEAADCGMLLDVNNVYVNSVNHGFDPYEFLLQLPLERVVQIHIAGHNYHENTIIDTHSEAVCEPVYELLAFVLKRVRPKGVMLERDDNFPGFENILAELRRIRKICEDSMAPDTVNDTTALLKPIEVHAVTDQVQLEIALIGDLVSGGEGTTESAITSPMKVCDRNGDRELEGHTNGSLGTTTLSGTVEPVLEQTKQGRKRRKRSKKNPLSAPHDSIAPSEKPVVLADVERVFARVVLDRIERDDIVAHAESGDSEAGGFDARHAEQLDLYGRITDAGALATMQSMFQVTKKLLGEDVWTWSIAEYYHRHPPLRYVLLHVGEKYPEFLSSVQEQLPNNYAVEMADFEWTRISILEAEVAWQNLPAPEFSQSVGLSNRKPALNPSLTIKSYSFNVVELFDLLQAEDLSVLEVGGPARIAFVRNSHDQEVMVFEVAPRMDMLLTEIGNASSYADLFGRLLKREGAVEPVQQIMGYVEELTNLHQWNLIAGDVAVGVTANANAS